MSDRGDMKSLAPQHWPAAVNDHVMLHAADRQLHIATHDNNVITFRVLKDDSIGRFTMTAQELADALYDLGVDLPKGRPTDKRIEALEAEKSSGAKK